MPHRRGSFREDRNELLKRFAHRGTPAASEDQLRDSCAMKQHARTADIHQQLFKLPRDAEVQKNGTDEKVG